MIRAIVAAAIVALLITIGISARHQSHKRPQPKLAGSVVKIIVMADGKEIGHGSGVHIGNGYILTAAHVAKDATEMTFRTDGGAEETAEVLWSAKAYDVALLHTGAKLAASEISCKPHMTGESVRAIGNPFQLDFISTWGKIGGAVAGDDTWKSAIIVDMTIVPGMSGGGLFDAAGKLIGILVGVVTAPTGLGVQIIPIGYVVPMSGICGMLGKFELNKISLGDGLKAFFRVG